MWCHTPLYLDDQGLPVRGSEGESARLITRLTTLVNARWSGLGLNATLRPIPTPRGVRLCASIEGFSENEYFESGSFYPPKVEAPDGDLQTWVDGIFSTLPGLAIGFTPAEGFGVPLWYQLMLLRFEKTRGEIIQRDPIAKDGSIHWFVPANDYDVDLSQRVLYIMKERYSNGVIVCTRDEATRAGYSINEHNGNLVLATTNMDPAEALRLLW